MGRRSAETTAAPWCFFGRHRATERTPPPSAERVTHRTGRRERRTHHLWAEGARAPWANTFNARFWTAYCWCLGARILKEPFGFQTSTRFCLYAGLPSRLAPLGVHGLDQLRWGTRDAAGFPGDFVKETASKLHRGDPKPKGLVPSSRGSNWKVSLTLLIIAMYLHWGGRHGFSRHVFQSHKCHGVFGCGFWRLRARIEASSEPLSSFHMHLHISRWILPIRLEAIGK